MRRKWQSLLSLDLRYLKLCRNRNLTIHCKVSQMHNYTYHYYTYHYYFPDIIRQNGDLNMPAT